MTRRQTLARLFADRKTRRITFIRRDGSLREMTFEYRGGAIQGKYMTVWDLDKQAIRKINLMTIQGCGVVLKQKKQALANALAGIDMLFA